MFAVAIGACGGDATPTTSVWEPTSAVSSTTSAPSTSVGPTSTAASTTVVSSTSTSSTVPSTASTSTVPVEQPTVLVYFLRREVLTVAARAVDVASPEAAMRALLDGPTADEVAAGAVSVVPAGTRLLGVDLNGNEAVVDLSAEFAEGGGSLSLIARVTQVVFTVTQFPGVDTVRFRIDGEPVQDLGGEGLYVDGLTRTTYDWLVPYVLLERPAPGSTVTRPLRLVGLVGEVGPELVVEVRDRLDEVVYSSSVPRPVSDGPWAVLDMVLADLPPTVSGSLLIRVVDPQADPSDERSRPAEVVVTL